MAMITWLFISWIHDGKPSMTGALDRCSGGISHGNPAAGYIQPWAAAIIGVVAGIRMLLRDPVADSLGMG